MKPGGDEKLLFSVHTVCPNFEKLNSGAVIWERERRRFID